MTAAPVNVRDVGGLPLADGGVTVTGVLTRGDALYAGDEPPGGMGWPPALVVDLRSGAERRRSPFPWPGATRVVSHELFDPGDLSRLPRNTDLLDVYRGMVAHAGRGIATLVDVMPEGGGTYLHCSAGKDRTGTAVAALLLLAGVQEEAIIADYARTEVAMNGVLDRLVTVGALQRGAWDPAWAKAPAEAIKLVIDEVGSGARARSWFVARGASEAGIDRWVRRIAGG